MRYSTIGACFFCLFDRERSISRDRRFSTGWRDESMDSSLAVGIFKKVSLQQTKSPLQAVFMHIVSDATGRVFPTKLSHIVLQYSLAENMLLVFCSSTRLLSFHCNRAISHESRRHPTSQPYNASSKPPHASPPSLHRRNCLQPA